MGWERETYVKSRREGFKGLFPGNMSLVEVSPLAGMLIKYEEDFILCSQIEEAMRINPNLNYISDVRKRNYNKVINTKKLYGINL